MMVIPCFCKVSFSHLGQYQCTAEYFANLPNLSLLFLRMSRATIQNNRCKELSSFLFQLPYFCTADIFRPRWIDFYCVCQSFLIQSKQVTHPGPLQTKKGSNSYPVRDSCFAFLFLLLAEVDLFLDLRFLVLERF